MQRRRFVQAVTTASAAAEVLSAQQASPAADPAKISTIAAEAAADPVARFFSPRQLASLKHLSGLLQPATNGRPGAIEAGAAEFLDFYVGSSPKARQTLYRAGIDFLEAESQRLFKKDFPQLTAEQADKILHPLLTPWTFELPTNPLQRFLAEVRADVRTATMNSKEMSQVAATAPRRRRGPGGAAPYWLPIDPTRQN